MLLTPASLNVLWLQGSHGDHGQLLIVVQTMAGMNITYYAARTASLCMKGESRLLLQQFSSYTLILHLHLQSRRSQIRDRSYRNRCFGIPLGSGAGPVLRGLRTVALDGQDSVEVASDWVEAGSDDEVCLRGLLRHVPFAAANIRCIASSNRPP